MWIVGLLTDRSTRLYDHAVVREVFSPRPEVAVGFGVRVLAAGASVPLEDGVTVRRTHPLSAAAGCDLLVVPGSAHPLAAPDPRSVAAVRAAYDAGATVASLCSGALLLAATGLLDGREATTHWRYGAELARRHPRVRVTPDVLFTGSGRLWTSAGVTAGNDLLLHLVRTRWGADVAGAIARSMVTPAFRRGSQAQFVPAPVPPASGGDWLEDLQLAVAARPADDWSLTRLAAQCSTSVRTLTRRFARETGTSPVDWVITQRVQVAQLLLETTDLPVETVAHRAGFSSADLLRKHFHALHGIAPTTHRAQFRGC